MLRPVALAIIATLLALTLAGCEKRVQEARDGAEQDAASSVT